MRKASSVLSILDRVGAKSGQAQVNKRPIHKSFAASRALMWARSSVGRAMPF